MTCESAQRPVNGHLRAYNEKQAYLAEEYHSNATFHKVPHQSSGLSYRMSVLLARTLQESRWLPYHEVLLARGRAVFGDFFDCLNEGQSHGLDVCRYHSSHIQAKDCAHMYARLFDCRTT